MNITPPEGVRAFVRSFGGLKQCLNAASALGLELRHGQLKRYVEEDAMPDYVYNSLKHLIISEELEIAHGFLEFYANGKSVGKFYLPKGISVIMRSGRNRIKK